MVRKNKNIIVIKEEVEIAKGVFLSEGDALIKTRNGWTLIEADAEDDEKKDDEDLEEEDDAEDEEDMDDKDEDAVEEKKKKENYRRRR